MKILAAIDNSSSTAAVLNAIAAQAQPQKTSVRVLHVLQPVSIAVPPQMSPGYAPELEPFAKPARELLAEAEKTLAASGFKVETMLKKGDVRDSIIDTAKEWGADLILLGSGAHRFLLGGVAESIVRYAPCSVEIVRTPKPH
ncbi:MAG TPA: universal stress protein [Candidatus Cybelea sp.]|nr:universal stress protein [Candidatus Cybelea sp.]